MGRKQFKIDIKVVEIDPTHGTGREKDERTEIKDVASINLRHENLPYLLSVAVKHLDLLAPLTLEELQEKDD